jgi:streptogramin lyase
MTGRQLRTLLPAFMLMLVACNPVAPGAGPSSSPPSSSNVTGAGAGTSAVTRVSGLDKPFGVAAGGDSVWVTEYQLGNLVRIDPATNRSAKVHVGLRAAQLIVQDGFVWVIDDQRRFIIQVDATSNRVINEIPMETAFDLWPIGLAGSAGSVWVTLGSRTVYRGRGVLGELVRVEHLGELVRIDTATSAKTTIVIDGVAAGVTIGADAVWVTTVLPEPTSIFRIDPATNRVVARVETGQPVSGPLAYADSGLWVANNNGYLTRIDSRTNKVVGNFEVGSPEWAAMLPVGKNLWISAPLDNILARFDSGTGTVTRTIHAGSRPQGFAFLGNDIWAANYTDGTVVKLPIN